MSEIQSNSMEICEITSKDILHEELLENLDRNNEMIGSINLMFDQLNFSNMELKKKENLIPQQMEQIASLQKTIEKMKEEREEIIKSKCSQIDSLKNENKQLQEKVVSFENEINKLKCEIQQMRNEINQKDSVIKDNSVEINRISEENKAKNIEICKLNNQVQQLNYMGNTLVGITDDERMIVERWTEKKCGGVLFDSKVNNWDRHTSLFDINLINKKQLLFVITDECNNKFGGYLNNKIIGMNQWIFDPKAFVFSLQSNGRLSSAMKFNVAKPQNAFNMDTKSGEWFLILFGGDGGIGHDITLRKSNMVRESYCHQGGCYNYGGLNYPLAGKRNFTMKRIVVIQMI